jgi:hypothetical protein
LLSAATHEDFALRVMAAGMTKEFTSFLLHDRSLAL